MLVPKTKEMKAFIESNFEVESKPEVELSYKSDGEISKCKFSGEYLWMVWKLIKNAENVWLSVKKDYPLTIETEDFKVILAPRMENV